jgi:hypothetical protein
MLCDMVLEKNSSERMAKVHPMEGVTSEVSFTSEIRGDIRFPSGQNLGSGIMTKYPHGIIDATWRGTLIRTEDGRSSVVDA